MYKMVRVLSTFLFTIFGLTAGSAYPCPVRREIAPCTCRLQEPKLTTIVVSCEQMPSFANIVEVLHNRFPPEQDISLKVTFSQLDDLQGKSFKDLGMSVSNLNLNFDDLSYLDEASFAGLEGVEYLSLADNRLTEIPRIVFQRMQKIKTLDLGRSKISALLDQDFVDLPTLKHLLLPGNTLAKIETNSLPKTMRRIHLGRNNLRDLNSSLRALTDLEWLFINSNQLTTLMDQLPPEAEKLILIHAANNQLKRLPPELRNYLAMDSLFFNNNDIEFLDGVLQRARRLKRLHLTHNKIEALADDEFADSESMDDIELGHNHIHTLNGAFLPMKKLRTLNLTHNHLQEFSVAEIRGLQNLKVVDLSHNRIERLGGHMGNQVEFETRVEELHLEYNELEALEGALLGIHGLQRLSLNNNKLKNIAPDDLIGLDDLRLLDISHNHLKTLEETSKTFLPRLEELVATHNFLTSVEKDFHGLPVLCKADLSHNVIKTIGSELGTKSHCRGTGGLLIVALYNNPILCHPEFNVTMDYLQKNLTLLQGDTSICPPPPPPSTTTTTTPLPPMVAIPATPAGTTEPLPTQALPETPLMDLVALMRNQPPPQVVPLLFNAKLAEKIESNHVEKLGETAANSTESRSEAATTEKALPVELEAKKEDIVHHPIVVLKDEGQNLTLVIPMENGVIKKDHGIDKYVQKDEDDALNQSNRPAAITNIEIVDINPLPKESPSVTVVGREDRPKNND